jgi:serine/threonine-protein kinase HipA
MRLAATIGLDVAPVEPRSVEGRSFLLVERYDRAGDGRGVVHRIHQEDFCQALGVPPETKYASEGGPTFKDCFELLRRVSARPATDVLKLLDAAIFNLVVGNADAHGKNFSILYDDQGPRIAPLYDLLSTIAYSDFSPKMAMRIGKRATLAEMDADGWQTFAKEAGVGLPLVRRRITDLVDSTAEAVARVVEDISDLCIDSARINHFADLIAGRAKLVRVSI